MAASARKKHRMEVANSGNNIAHLGPAYYVPGLVITDHKVNVPLDYTGTTICVRHLCSNAHVNAILMFYTCSQENYLGLSMYFFDVLSTAINKLIHCPIFYISKVRINVMVYST